MAEASYYKTLLGALPQAEQRALGLVLDMLLRELRLGQPTPGSRAAGGNFQLYPVQTTTPATPDEEFSIEHGIGRAPYVAIPALDLTAVNAETARVRVTRAADANRIYLSCSEASAPITLYLEA